MGITARNENYHFLRKKQFKTIFNNQTMYMYIQQTGAKVYLENKCCKVDSCKAKESIGRIKKREKESEKKKKKRRCKEERDI